MAPGFYNIGQIFGVAILAPAEGYSFGGITLPAFGFGIYGLVYGVILGALLHLGIQIPGLFRYQFRWIPAIDLRHPGMHKLLRLLRATCPDHVLPAGILYLPRPFGIIYG
jgi:putative peptidoglycan lipid II flippase